MFACFPWTCHTKRQPVTGYISSQLPLYFLGHIVNVSTKVKTSQYDVGTYISYIYDVYIRRLLHWIFWNSISYLYFVCVFLCFPWACHEDKRPCESLFLLLFRFCFHLSMGRSLFRADQLDPGPNCYVVTNYIYTSVIFLYL